MGLVTSQSYGLQPHQGPVQSPVPSSHSAPSLDLFALPASLLVPSFRAAAVGEPPSGSEQQHIPTTSMENDLADQDPNSKAISFAHDIDRLGCTWSDTYKYFDGKLCDVKIHGRGIPIRYWSVIFKLNTPLRKQMNDWQWVAERYTESTPEEFWDEFSVDSDSNTKLRMSWKQITETLHKRRKQVDLANGVGFRQRRRKSEL
ncbi:hypothetical protein E1B28_007815 [Marasmius oreades]|uniref:Uncharacterized protein n=1 Tax=Marasmius oreades TaxID=181124 RepID=A0A9P7S2Z2_9AGAR|nr:uncharacterized protein E1B28_007815 [Marasmius oreades]KAG7094208.1 hypothetical protein E1B28_007815 [Marasmius oreades]